MLETKMAAAYDFHISKNQRFFNNISKRNILDPGWSKYAPNAA